jgi:dTDP-glucose 4,6-dehydratase
MTTVLLTGIGGFIGSHVLEAILRSTDWNVVGIASWQHYGTPERVLEVCRDVGPGSRERVAMITHDLSVPFAPRTRDTLCQLAPEYIVNCAAESHVDRSIDEPLGFLHNNLGVATTMLELAREAKPRVFLQVSTDEVYGPAAPGTAHREWDPILPSNPYSASKACQEAAAVAYWRTYGVPLLLTNTMNNFGPRQDREKYPAKIVRAVLAGEELTVHGREGTIGSRFYLHAGNHAAALLWLLQRERPPASHAEGALRPERFNVVGDREIDNLEFAHLIAALLNRPLRYKLVDFHATRPGHDQRYALDGGLLRSLGWTAPMDFTESLSLWLEWSLSHPEW